MSETSTVAETRKNRKPVLQRSANRPLTGVTINPGRVEYVYMSGSTITSVERKLVDKDIPETLLDTLAVIGKLPIEASMSYMRMLTHAISGQEYGSLVVDDDAYILDINHLTHFKPVPGMGSTRIINTFGTAADPKGSAVRAELEKLGFIYAPSVKTKGHRHLIMLELKGPMTADVAQRKTEMSPYEELMDYADETAANTKGWEGELIGAVEVFKRFRISAGSLKHYRDQNKIITFPHGSRKFRYPAEQFVGTSIVRGIDAVREIINVEAETWLWLTQPSATLDGARPIDELKRKKLQAVLDAAHQQYDL